MASTAAIHQSPNRKRSRDPKLPPSYVITPLPKPTARSCTIEAVVGPASIANGNESLDADSVSISIPSCSTLSAVKPYSAIQSRKQINGNSGAIGFTNGNHTTHLNGITIDDSSNDACDSSGVAGNRVQHLVSFFPSFLFFCQCYQDFVGGKKDRF